MPTLTDSLEQISAPAWVVIALVVLVAVAQGLGALSTLIGAVTSAVKGLGSVGRSLRKRPDEGQRLRRRQRFAKDVRRKLQLLEGKEWSDERFTELEAQVIIERTERSRFAILNLLGPGRALRYQRSLTKALRNASDEMILLQGDPGCGKSVALRHVALLMADRAASSRRLDAVIPLYVNLKGLRRRGRSIDAALIQDYVNETLHKDINADIERFLDEEYERGLTEGTWFLLFDSFDEIPDILGSSRLDETVRDYSQAIATFLSGMRPCQGILASREFHSPKGLPWPAWQIKPLTAKRQRTLVHRYLLDRDKEGALLAGLEAADSGIVQDASNPLFLSLLAEYVRQHDQFPPSSHAVYEAYIDQRFTTDAQRVEQRFTVTAQVVRAVAERVAFCMSDEEGVGLDPTREELLDLLERRGLAESEVAMICMDALEYLKLVHGQPSGSDPLARVFTFTHRRFQEYFTTAAVLGSIGDVSADALLSDLRWRETAVTLCQLQRDSAAPLVQRAGQVLANAGGSVEPLTAEERAAVAMGCSAAAEDHLDEPWPESTLEVLGILQAGFSSEPERLPADVREQAGRLLEHIFWRGLTYDRVSAVSVVAVAPPRTFDAIIRGAFKSGSKLLADQAYRQLARLQSLPIDLAAEIRRTLLRLCADGTLRREALTVRAQLKRFDSPRALLQAQRLALAAPRVELLILLAIPAILVFLATWHGNRPVDPPVAFIAVAVTLAAVSHLTLYDLAATLGGASGRGWMRGWLLGLTARSYLLMIVFFYGEGWLVLPLAALGLAWAPAALFAVRRGEFMHPATYPFVFLSPVVAIGLALRGLSWRGWLSGLLRLLAIAVMGGVTILISEVLPSAIIIYYGLIGVWFLYVMPIVWRNSRRFLRDTLWYRRWNAQPQAELTASGLMSLLEQAQTVRTATRVIADVRVRELLQPEPEAYTLLGDLARVARFGAPQQTSSARWQTPSFGDWLEAAVFVRTTGGLPFGNDFEDEIARLVGTLRERRVTRRTEAAPAG